MSTILIRGGRVVDPAQEIDEVTDLAIKDGKIAALGKSAPKSADEVVEAGGLIVAPGFIDMHVHLREPGREDAETIETGTNAAARLANGTVVFCFPSDYLVWTENNARLAESLDRQVSALSDVRGKEIRIAGGISPQARKALESLGWKVLNNQKGFST